MSLKTLLKFVPVASFTFQLMIIIRVSIGRGWHLKVVGARNRNLGQKVVGSLDYPFLDLGSMLWWHP